jgi:hypothetical protein
MQPGSPTAVFVPQRRALGLIAYALGALVFCFPSFASAQAAADPTTLRVQILSGKTGRPVANQHFLLLRKDGHPLEGTTKVGETTDGEGYAPIPNVDTSGPEVRIWTDGYQPCSRVGKRNFSLAKVRTLGVVSENACRPRITMYPQPGTLIFYVREETIFEKMRR